MINIPREFPLSNPVILSNGRYAVVLAGNGAGASVWRDLLLNRWSGDAVEDAGGFHLYLRDAADGQAWSAGLLPELQVPESYSVSASPGVAAVRTRQHGIESELQVCVSPRDDYELRRLTLRNLTARPRRIEVTATLEVVLHQAGAFLAHPGFSKLFVQTEYEADAQCLLARRRPRASGEHYPWLGLAVSGAAVEGVETDRMRFIGRGRHLGWPAALDAGATLSGTVGNVLDPVFAQRVMLDLAPGEVRSVVFCLGVGDQRESCLARVTAGARAWDETLAAAVAAAGRFDAEGLAPFPFLLRAVATARPAVVRAEPRAVQRASAPVATVERAGDCGGFSHDGRAYVLHVTPDAEGRLSLPPLPWTNVVANERAGFIVSETGAAYTWARNSREHRLTPWHNDPVCDPHGEAWFVRDEDSGVFWSLTPGPAPAPARYTVRHGLGYSLFESEHAGLAQSLALFVPTEDPLKVARVHLRNLGASPRRVSLFAYARWVLGVAPEDTAPSIVTEWDSASAALLARNPAAGDFADGVAFAAAVAPAGCVVHYTADRADFIGWGGSLRRPRALTTPAPLAGRSGAGLDPCAALQLALELPPGGEVEAAFLLGEHTAREGVAELLSRYRTPGASSAALDHARSYWEDLVGGLQIETPEPALDRMVNAWLPYQNLSCRIRGRSAFYQSGGAFGFRDQLQDAAALVYHDPAITQRQILLNAAHQFVEGDVLHWWHPPLSRGIRTRFSDDLLWLPYLALHYAKCTGDWGVFDEVLPYLHARTLAPGEDEAFLRPEPSGVEGDVYDHCCRALDRSLATGAHGLPLMGTGDWNDGMNRVGREGRGESVWVGFFLYVILGDFIGLCERRGDLARARRYAAHRSALRTALNADGWDGEWYRRAWYDNGAVLGSKDSDECQIDALAQSWAVISGAAPPERAALAMDAVERRLVDEDAGIIRLLTPAFDRTPNDPGYIKGYVPGVRENGGQYTHAALWVVRALAELGCRDRAAPLLAMLSPVSHTRDADAIRTYMTEPYVVAADVYGVAPHNGRGGWTWYTGSAGWMLRVAVENILGLTWEGGRQVRVKPCIPDAWHGFRLTWRVPGLGVTLELVVENPTRCSADVVGAWLDGTPVSPAADGAVVVELSERAGRQVLRVALGSGVGQ